MRIKLVLTCMALTLAAVILTMNSGLETQKSIFSAESIGARVRAHYDTSRFIEFEVDNKAYLSPKDYGGDMGRLAFFWPSKAPGQRPDLAAEFDPGTQHIQNNYQRVVIEIFINSSTVRPKNLHNFEFIKHAERVGWVLEKHSIRPELDEYTMRNVIDEYGNRINYVKYYVATKLQGADGLPPVASCSFTRADDVGGTGFQWRNAWVGTKMNNSHCQDWPEIYQEISRVLNLVEEAK
jgi:hypothetical protein